MLKSKYNSLAQQGFTLIELLVVVLIIGILATTAVTQYKKSVNKSRFAYLQTVGSAFVRSQEEYFLNNGAWNTTNFKLFSLLPEGTLNASKTKLTMDDVTCQFNGSGNFEILCCYPGRNDLPCWVYSYYTTNGGSVWNRHGVFCRARSGNNKDAKFCKSVGATYYTVSGDYDWYKITML